MGEREAATDGDHVAPPRRSVRFTLEVHADSFVALGQRLYDLSLEVERPISCASVWGGPSDGGSWTMEVDESMTHDRYMDELEAWRAAQSAGTQGGVG